MVFLDIRELLQFPGGNNDTDVVINDVHFNLTALKHFNYTLYDNGTLSNASSCYLIFQAYQPSMLNNGTFFNGTSCYDPYYSIRSRGSLGITAACLFAASIVCTLVNLRKHGRRFLPSEKRFRAVGRRWQWYWLLWVAGCGIISGITSVDVDRDYLQNLPIILQSFFYFLMNLGIIAAVWEGVRHWGSWQERQICDRDPFLLPQDDTRGKKEFYLPLIFYLLAFLNFFMVIPRSWTNIESQGSIQQIDTKARPTATDGRFKAGCFFLFLAWVVICYDLTHIFHYYKPHIRGSEGRMRGFIAYTPVRFLVVLPLCLVIIGYSFATAWDFEISPLKFDVNPGWIYGLGYAPVLLISFIFQLHGALSENEDRQILAQRRDRERQNDDSLGLHKKPKWWSREHREHHTTAESRLKALTTEIGGGAPTQRNIESALEMGNISPRKHDDDTEDILPDGTTSDGPRMELSLTHWSRTPSERKASSVSSTPSTTAQMQPTKIRSMLDV